MVDGYYLSAYIHIDELAYWARLKVRHDQNISLWEKRGTDIKLIHYWELERLTGYKRHNISFKSIDQAVWFINELLANYNLAYDDIIEVWGTPLLPKYVDCFSGKKMEEYTVHSIGHLYSSLMINTGIFYNENILGLSVDGGPDLVLEKKVSEKYLYAGAICKKGEISMTPICSPGWMWIYFRKKYYNLREGTLMALAHASSSTLYYYKNTSLPLMQLKDFHNIAAYVDDLVAVVWNLKPEDEGVLFSGYDERFSKEENNISMIMKEIQKMSYLIMEKNIEELVERFHIDTEQYYLAISGGYALNCPTNSHLMKKYKFKGLIAPPNVNDSGLSLGFALYAFYNQMNFVNFSLTNAYWGDREINTEQILGDEKYKHYIDNITQLTVEKVVEDICNAPVVWYQGAAEMGPRALGNRSILADPTNTESKINLNEIKQRQWWRPVAPIVLEEDMGDWFEESRKSPFMLQTFRIRPEKLDFVPAIAHLDDTARVQTLSFEDNPILYDVITQFKKAKGVPLLCNTSLNDRNEPIVNSIEEAFNFALRKNIGIMYINGLRVSLKNHTNFYETSPATRPYSMLFDEERTRISRLKSLNPYSLSTEVLTHYITSELRDKFDLRDKEDVRLLTLYASIQQNMLGRINSMSNCDKEKEKHGSICHCTSL